MQCNTSMQREVKLLQIYTAVQKSLLAYVTDIYFDVTTIINKNEELSHSCV